MTKDQLADLLASLDLTPREVGQLLGRSQRTIYGWLAGETAIPRMAAILLRGLQDRILPPAWLAATLRETARHV